MKLDEKKLMEWARQIHQNACVHGWHDENKSTAHWLCMVVTEIAEAVEADRKGRRFFSENYHDFELRKNRESHVSAYECCVKGTLEEEFADIVIRILDFAYERYGERMKWTEWKTSRFPVKSSFTEKAFTLIRWMTNDIDCNTLSLFVQYMYEWAASLSIDLDYHIVAKMKYNECRPYKHSNKKY